MKKRLVLGFVASAALVASAYGDVPAPLRLGAKRILLVVVDTLRRDHVSAYNEWIPTPNIDRLARRGQVFRNAVSSFHQTTMSMGALFSGRTPSAESGSAATPLVWTHRNWCGLARYAERSGDTCVPRGVHTLAERLRAVGYRTLGVVSNRMLFRPMGYEQGFDRWIEVSAGSDERSPEVRTRRRSAPHVLKAVRRILPQDDQPTFLYVHYVDVHDYRFAAKKYMRAVVDFDAEFGKLLDLLEASGWLDDAVVFFTSDHGETFDETHPLASHRGHGGSPSYQSVLEIPLIVAPPRFDDADRWIRGEDLGGLILEVAGVAGETSGEADPLAPDELFVGERHFVVYRKGRWKSVFHRRSLGQVALFDLEADPKERTNLASREPEILKRHAARVKELVERLGSPPVSGDRLSEDDLSRLRALGYAE